MTQNKKRGWKARIESGFATLGYAMGRHPWRWLLSCLLLVGAMASQLPSLQTDTSVEGFLAKGSSAIQRYDQFKEIFGRDELFIITIATDDAYTPQFAHQLHTLHQQLQDEVPHIKFVDSLANARYTWGEDDTLYIEDLLPDPLPEDAAAREKLKQYALHNDNYRDFLISADGHMVTILLRMEPFRYSKQADGTLQRSYMGEEEGRAADSKIRQILQPYRGVLSDDIRVTGSLAIANTLSNSLEHDFTLFSALANVLIGIVLFIIFRRFSGVFMPLLIMSLGVVVTLSLMAIAGTPIQVSTSILPAFLLAVCVGDSIHLLTIFYHHYDRGDDKHHAIASAMSHTALAMLFTSITTAVGLASFAFSELTPVAALGIYGALGSLVAFVLTIVVLPCLIAILPLRHRRLRLEENRGLQPLLAWSARVATGYPKLIVSMGVILLLVCVAIVSRISFSHYPLAWLPEQHETRQAMVNYEQHMGSTVTVEIMLDTGQDRGVINAPLLQTLDRVQQELVTWRSDHWQITKAISVVNIIKESNRALHDNDPAAYGVPDASDLISQELFLVELDAPDDVLNVVDKTYRVARLTLTMPWFDAIYTRDLMSRLRQYLDQQFQPLGVNVTITGVVSIMGTTFGQMLTSTAESYGFAAIAISLMMILLIGNVKLGLLSMLPSLLPILMVLAAMQLLGYKLDILTMLVGSIAIGLTVDDNIHFMHGFRRLYLQTGDPVHAVTQTLLSTGRAMLITSIVLSMGFAIYTQSLMSNMVTFGVITASCIVLALVATYLLGPALMVLANRRRPLQ